MYLRTHVELHFLENFLIHKLLELCLVAFLEVWPVLMYIFAEDICVFVNAMDLASQEVDVEMSFCSAVEEVFEV